MPGQWGLEPDFHDYLKKMQELMKELNRILKQTGTCWINLGDSYSTNVGNSEDSDVPEKSLMGIPGRFYTQCIDNGWICRNFIPWYKENSMPTSIKDRFANKWEPIFYFVKNNQTLFWHNKKTHHGSSLRPLGTEGVENVDFEFLTCPKCEGNSTNCDKCKGLGKIRKSFWIGYKYFFNLNAVRVKPKSKTKSFNRRVRENMNDKAQEKLGDKSWKASDQEKQNYNVDGTRKMADVPGQRTQGIHRNRQKGLPDFEGWGDNKQDSTVGADGKPKPTYKGFNKRWQDAKDNIYGDDDNGARRSRVRAGNDSKTFSGDSPEHYSNIMNRIQDGRDEGADHDGVLNHPAGKNPGDFFTFEDLPLKVRIHYDENGYCLGCGEHWSKHTVSERARGSMSEAIKRTEPVCWCNPLGKNPGDVFFINPKPFSQAHFATYPIELPTKCLKCGCPDKVCIKCGMPRFPILKPSKEYEAYLRLQKWSFDGGDLESGHRGKKQDQEVTAQYKITGWTRCSCNAEFIPGIVLDPFMGAGTTAVAAEELGLRWIGIELSESYIKNIITPRLQPYLNKKLEEFA